LTGPSAAAAEPESPLLTTAEFPVATGANGGAGGTAPVRQQRSVRIDLRRLDNLMNLIGELVITRGRLTQLSALIDDPALAETVTQTTRLVADLQDEIMTSRMVPVWQVFDRFPRLVRDAAHSVQKQVDFIIEGKDVELDRSMLDEVGDQIRERGHEFGTVTGRPRRIGWFDSAVARYSVRLNGVGCAALMRLDILDDQPLLKICTGYNFRGKRFDHPLANISHYKHCEPVYEDMPGWQHEIGAAKCWDDLPQACRDYVDRIGELIGAPVELVGTGPRRDQFVTRGRTLFD